jgi:hypothetical protein
MEKAEGGVRPHHMHSHSHSHSHSQAWHLGRDAAVMRQELAGGSQSVSPPLSLTMTNTAVVAIVQK